MAVMLVKVSRTFTGGTLNGITIPQEYTADARLAPAPGGKIAVPFPIFNGSPYTDVVLSVEPAAVSKAWTDHLDCIHERSHQDKWS
jgi:hypothetical protein